MKSSFVIALFTGCLLAVNSIAQTIPLSNNWTYTMGNNTNAAGQSKPSEKEMPWVEKDSALRNTGLVVFRRKLTIPASLKAQWNKTGVAALYLGRILQADETFFNGVSIGKTGSSDVQRVYAIPANLIKWNGENNIEIKVEHWGQKGGSLTAPYLAEAKAEHLFFIRNVPDENIRKASSLNKAATHRLEINSIAGKEVTGTVSAQFFNGKNELLHREEKKMAVSNGVSIVPFTFKSPASFVKILYTLQVPGFNYSVSWNEAAGYEPVIYKAAAAKVALKVPLLFKPAALNNQKMEGWLGERFNINMNMRLKQVDELALLEGYINKPGKHSWIGEHVGKFLEAACNTYMSTGDDSLKIQIDRTAQQLLSAQKKDGYLGTYTTDNEWTSWDVWSHKYNLVGLLSYYELSGYEPALAGAVKIGDLLARKFGTAEGQRDIIKSGAHMGMAATSIIDPVTDLYIFTGDKKYLDFCYYILESYNVKNGPAIIQTLNATGGRVDKTANAKAYEMMSNLVGLVKLYKITADTAQLNPVLKAWKDIVDKRLYITGTTSSFEHFQDDHLLPASPKDNMGEGCVTTTWIQLNYQLLLISGKMAYVDELERSVYNHLPGAENPQSGCVSYYTPLQGKKPYGCNITCCMSSVPRGIAMIPLFANGKLNGSPAFNFYQPGEFKTSVKNTLNKTGLVSFSTGTDFLQQGNVDITVNPAAEAAFDILLRKPYWATNFTVAVNGKAVTSSGDEFTTVRKIWKKGDAIAIRFQLAVVAHDGNISYPGMVAIQRGPQVLSYDQTLNKQDVQEVRLSANPLLQDGAALLPQNWIGRQGYVIENGANGAKDKILLVPYADASQTGGVMSTWIKKQEANYPVR